MSALFADTFYWIALTNVPDLAHEKVKGFSRAAKPNVIWTTEEVLTEYLNYFAGWARISGVRQHSTSRTCWATEPLDCSPNCGFLSKRLRPLPRAAGQKVQLDGLHLHAGDAQRRHLRRVNQRCAF